MTNKYLYLYSGGNAPKSEAEGKAEGKAMMGAWMAYFAELSKAIVDGGAPFAPKPKTIGVAKPCHASGYSIVEAASLADAIKLTDGHPRLVHGGGIEVFEIARPHGA